MKARCSTCNKKIRIGMEYTCKCDLILCMKHSLSVDHQCTFDYNKHQQEWLRKTMETIKAQKITHI